jgi:hypothetical protein
VNARDESCPSATAAVLKPVDRVGVDGTEMSDRLAGGELLTPYGQLEPLAPRNGMSCSVAQLHDTGNNA